MLSCQLQLHLEPESMPKREAKCLLRALGQSLDEQGILFLIFPSIQFFPHQVTFLNLGSTYTKYI